MSLMLYVCHLWQPYLSSALISDPAIPPKHVLLKLLMMGTGIYYFFHERDIEEFLIRLHLSYKHFNSLESLLLHDYIFEANYKGELIYLDTQDLQEAQGLIHAPNSQRQDREAWLQGAAQSWGNVMLAGVFCGFHLHGFKQQTKNRFLLDKKDLEFVVNEKNLSDARLFARQSLKEMDLEKIRKWHKEKKELILQVRSKSIKPFHYSKEAIPAELQEAILTNFAKYGYGMEEPFDYDMYNEEVMENVIYLAWLYANDLLQLDVQGVYVADGNFGFDYEVIEDTFDCYFYDAIFNLKLDEFKDALKAPVGTLPHKEEVVEDYLEIEL